MLSLFEDDACATKVAKNRPLPLHVREIPSVPIGAYADDSELDTSAKLKMRAGRDALGLLIVRSSGD